MSQSNIKPEKINSPIQLMAAWFVMLIILSGVLLTSAIKIEKPEWAAGFLVVSTVILILGVILSVVLMLTKFRPNLQDGDKYAEWLKDQNKYSTKLLSKKDKITDNKTLQNKIEQMKFIDSKQENQEFIIQIEKSILYKVEITNLDRANELINTMKNLGFDAHIYNPYEYDDEELTFENHQGIWLGSSIPTLIALIIIKNAIKVWPHLKYIHLSSDGSGPEEIDWQVFLGGSTNSAVNMFNLKPWTINEIDSLTDMEITDFHAKIRTKYP